MSSNVQYSVVLPITNQSEYKENDVIDFNMTIPKGMRMRQGSVRINGRLNVQVSVNNEEEVNLTEEHCVYLNPNVGVHALFNNWNIEFNGGIQETNTEYSRMVSAETEASQFYLDTVSDVSNLNELKSMSLSTKANESNYFSMVGDSQGEYTGYCPFSFKPRLCINKTSGAISGNKINAIYVKFQLESGYKQMKCDNPTITGLSYTMKELNLTYTLEPDMGGDSPLMMERVLVQANNSVVGSMANLQNTTPAPFTKLFMTFKDTTHVNTSTQFNYDYNLNETLQGINRLEFTVNSIDATYSYPLLSNDEILYNYLLVFRNGLDKDSLNLAKLRDSTISSGFGIGTKFFNVIPQNGVVSVDIVMNDAPANPIRVYTYFVSMITL